MFKKSVSLKSVSLQYKLVIIKYGFGFVLDERREENVEQKEKKMINITIYNYITI